jgi:hypothetical protein
MEERESPLPPPAPGGRGPPDFAMIYMMRLGVELKAAKKLKMPISVVACTRARGL